MNCKKILTCTLLSLSIIACSNFSNSVNSANSFQATEAIDRFQIQQDLVVDVRSNLMWTRCLLGAVWNGFTCEGKTVLYNWQQAQAVSKVVNYGGYNDWRIPTLAELKTLADPEKSEPISQIPRLNQAIFPVSNCYGMNGGLNSSENNACWHWSSSLIEGSDHYVWTVYFGYGYGNANYETDVIALRLVRNQR